MYVCVFHAFTKRILSCAKLPERVGGKLAEHSEKDGCGKDGCGLFEHAESKTRESNKSILIASPYNHCGLDCSYRKYPAYYYSNQMLCKQGYRLSSEE